MRRETENGEVKKQKRETREKRQKEKVEEGKTTIA